MSVDKFGYSCSASERRSNATTESKSTTDKFITLSRNLATKVWRYNERKSRHTS